MRKLVLGIMIGAAMAVTGCAAGVPETVTTFSDNGEGKFKTHIRQAMDRDETIAYNGSDRASVDAGWIAAGVLVCETGVSSGDTVLDEAAGLFLCPVGK